MERRSAPHDDAEVSGRDACAGLGSELEPVAVPLPAALFSRDESSPSSGRRALIRPVILGMLLGLALGWPLPSQPSTAGRLLERVLDLVDDRYVHVVDTEQLLFDTLDDMLRELDPNSRFFSPLELEAFEADTDGFFVGIGVVIEPSRKDTPPTIKAVIPKSPAHRAEIQRGDRILSVAGESVTEATLARVSDRIKGEPGSSVSITLLRETTDGESQEFSIDVRRERVSLPSVQAVRLYTGDDGAIGYVRLDQFQSGSTSELESSFGNLVAAGARKFVLDLRANRGGYLDEAVRIVDLFVSDGLILSTKGRTNPDKPELYHASGQTLFPDQPLLILIDGVSASASEIVAAALQDHRRALLIGEETYGKWSVQDVIRLPSRGGIVKLTTKSHHPPQGRWIRRDDDGRRRGLVPNVPVKIDAQTRAALRRGWREWMLEVIETPYQVVRTHRPSFESEIGESTNPVVDAALVRALGILSNAGDYAKIIAIDPDPLVLETATAKTDRAVPRGSSGPESPDGSVQPAVEQRADSPGTTTGAKPSG